MQIYCQCSVQTIFLPGRERQNLPEVMRSENPQRTVVTIKRTNQINLRVCKNINQSTSEVRSWLCESESEMCKWRKQIKGTQSAMGPRWPGHYFCRVWKAFTSTRNQIYASDTCRNLLQSCLVFHSILDLLLKISLWVNSSYYIILSHVVKNSIPRNVNRRGEEKRVGAGWVKSPSFYQNNKRNESVTLASK